MSTNYFCHTSAVDRVVVETVVDWMVFKGVAWLVM